MADWLLPKLETTYVLYRQSFNDRMVDTALMFDTSLTSATNIPVGAKGWNSTSSKFVKWSGSAWDDLASVYSISISGNAATATLAASVANGCISTLKYASLSIVSTAIAPQAVTLDKMVNMAGQYRVLGRMSSGAGSPEDITMQQVFGAVGGSTTGSIMVRNATSWAGIAPGGYGQYLKLPSSGTKLPYWSTLSVDSSNITGSSVNNFHVVPGTIPQRAGSLVVDATDTNAFSTVVSSNGLGILSCGTNSYGQLGCGSTTNMDTWVCGAFNKVTNAASVQKVVRAHNSVWVLFNNGTVYSCGVNYYGQLGHGDTTQRTIFTRIEYFVTNGVEISDIFVCASRYGSQDSVYFKATNGSVYACGYNGYGQLGVGDTNIRTAFTPISGGFTGVAKVHAWDGRSDSSGWALSQSAFLRTNAGEIYATGYNVYGQLGLGDTTQRTAFTKLTFSNPITQLANFGGGSHPSMFAVDSVGDCYAWGYNASGTIGDGTITNRSLPWKIVGWSEDIAATVMPWQSLGGIVQILEMGSTLGHGAGVILDVGGNLWGIGRANEGQLGLGSGLTNVTRWTRIPVPTMWSSNDLDRIVQLGRFGFDTAVGFMAITNSGLGGVGTGAGRVYATGTNGVGQTGTLSPRTASVVYTLQPCLLP